MKLGYKLRKLEIEIEHIARRLINIFNYLVWLFDPRRYVYFKKGSIKNLIVADFAGIGDIINTVGVVNTFKRCYPDVNIYFVTRKAGLSIIKGNPNIHFATSNAEDIKDKIDAAILMKIDEKNKQIIRKKTKVFIYAQPDSIFSNLKFWELYGIRRKFPRYYHWILRRFHCFELLGFKIPYNLEFYSGDRAKREAKKIYNKLNPKRKKIVLINPGSGKMDKAIEKKLVPQKWPAENFAKLADKLIKKFNCIVLITGAKNDESLANEIISKTENKKRISSVCWMGLEEFGAFIKLCDLMISLDTGAVHFAALAGVPTIDLMSAYPAKLYCAWAPSKDLESSKAVSIFHPEVCSGCRKYYCPEENPVCIKAISVDEVFEIANKFLNESVLYKHRQK